MVMRYRQPSQQKHALPIYYSSFPPSSDPSYFSSKRQAVQVSNQELHTSQILFGCEYFVLRPVSVLLTPRTQWPPDNMITLSLLVLIA
jgi:hypothetical protein